MFNDPQTLIIILASVAACLLLCVVILFVYIRKRIVKPFRAMKEYAENIADGNFDAPPKFKQNKTIAPVSDGFEILREELIKSREREMSIKAKETELVETLGHDMKNPVTAIKLTSELIRTKYSTKKDRDADDEYLIEKVENIYNKAEQLDLLANDLMASTLDGLGVFKVNCSDTESKVLEDIVRRCDDRGLVTMTSIPYVLVHIDTKRMSQVIGNIISNSYEYANTLIDVGFLLTDDFLQMKISDHGPGVPTDEIGFITDRFYRSRLGADSNEEGSGLGLYIAKTLMEMMDGKLLVENTGEGLCITLLIKLS